MENNISFNNMPAMIAEMLKILEQLTGKMEYIIATISPPDNLGQMMSLDQLIEYLPNHPAKQTVYGWISDHKIPYYKPGKNVLFKRSEIDKWLLGSDHRLSEAELQAEAAAYVQRKKPCYTFKNLDYGI